METDDADILEEQKLSNRKTNEELSISNSIYEGYKDTEIKRMVKQKKNSQLKP